MKRKKSRITPVPLMKFGRCTHNLVSANFFWAYRIEDRSRHHLVGVHVRGTMECWQQLEINTRVDPSPRSTYRSMPSTNGTTLMLVNARTCAQVPRKCSTATISHTHHLAETESSIRPALPFPLPFAATPFILIPLILLLSSSSRTTAPLLAGRAPYSSKMASSVSQPRSMREIN